MTLDLKEGMIDLPDGAKMYFFAFGTGEKPMVVIPGLSVRNYKGMAYPFAFLYRMFAKDFRVCVFDRRTPVYKGITAEDIAEDIHFGMEHLGIEDAAVLGVSQGGMIAQYLALNHPEKVGRMVLAVTLCRNNPTIVSAIDIWKEFARNKDFPGLCDDLFNRMYTAEYLRKNRLLLPVVTRLTKHMGAGRFLVLADACTTCDTYDRLPELKQPVLVIGGWHDNIVTPEASQEIYDQLLKRDPAIETELYIYEDGGHSVYEEAEDFDERVHEFLVK